MALYLPQGLQAQIAHLQATVNGLPQPMRLVVGPQVTQTIHMLAQFTFANNQANHQANQQLAAQVHHYAQQIQVLANAYNAQVAANAQLAAANAGVVQQNQGYVQNNAQLVAQINQQEGANRQLTGQINAQGIRLQQLVNENNQLITSERNQRRANEIRKQFHEAIEFWRKEENFKFKVKCWTAILIVAPLLARSDQMEARRRMRGYQLGLAYFDDHIAKNWKADDALKQVKLRYQITYF